MIKIYCLKDGDVFSFDVDFLTQVKKKNLVNPNAVCSLVASNYQGFFIYTLTYKGFSNATFYEKLTKKDMLTGMLGEYPIIPEYDTLEVFECVNRVITENRVENIVLKKVRD